MSRLRRWAKLFARTPLHPQWLLAKPEISGQWVRKHASGQVLDVGCANRWIQDWLERDCRYFGLDYPETGAAMYGARPDFFADACHLPVADASIDTVVFLEVMEHLRHPDKALCEIARVLRPKGRLLMSMPFLYPIHDAPHDFQRLTLHGLIRDLQAVGLRPERVEPVLGSAETAGLIANLALGGMIVQAIRRRSAGTILVPFIVTGILVVNLCSWVLARLLPSWDAVTSGYRVVANKDGSASSHDDKMGPRPGNGAGVEDR